MNCIIAIDQRISYYYAWLSATLGVRPKLSSRKVQPRPRPNQVLKYLGRYLNSLTPLVLLPSSPLAAYQRSLKPPLMLVQLADDVRARRTFIDYMRCNYKLAIGHQCAPFGYPWEPTLLEYLGTYGR